MNMNIKANNMTRLVLLVFVFVTAFSAVCQSGYSSFTISKDGSMLHYLPDKPVSLAHAEITDKAVNEYLIKTLIPLIARANLSINVKDEIYIAFRKDSVSDAETIIVNILPLRDAPEFTHFTQGSDIKFDNIKVVDNPYMLVYAITLEDIDYIVPTGEYTEPLQWTVPVKRFEFKDKCSLIIYLQYANGEFVLDGIMRERGYDHIPDKAIENTVVMYNLRKATPRLNKF